MARRIYRIGLAICLLLAGRSTGRANSYAFFPLERAPEPGEVVAFANGDGESVRPKKWLNKNDVQLFLKEGQLSVDPSTWNEVPREGDEPPCNGVFFTADGVGYYWTLLNPSALYLESADYRSGILILKNRKVNPGAAPEPEVWKELVAPKSGDVVGFAQGQRPADGAPIPTERKIVERFLGEGRTVADRREWQTLRGQMSSITVPERVRAFFYKNFPKHDEDNKVDPQNFGVMVGVLATGDGRIFYCEQWDDRLMHLQDERGRECLLRLP